MATPTEAAVSSQAQTRITYHEPSFPDLATITSFLYLVQVCRNLADWAFGAGLLGEIAVGVVYGPVANIMLPEWEETFIVVGYLGLVLIVFGEQSHAPSLQSLTRSLVCRGRLNDSS